MLDKKRRWTIDYETFRTLHSSAYDMPAANDLRYSLRLLARSQNEFEVESVSARVTFNADGDAPAKSMTLNQNGRTMEAVRARD